MRDLGLDLIVSVADGSVVACANKLHCPVFGRDSDYFIFNVENGYIPIQFDDKGPVVDLGEKVNCFSYKMFDKHFSLPSPDSRLLFPLFLGKNNHDQPVNPKFGIDYKSDTDCKLLPIIRDIDLHRMKSDLGCPKEKVDALYNLYRFQEQAWSIPPHIPQWTLELLKIGQFMLDAMNFLKSRTKTWRYAIIIEDMSQPSAWEITSTLRPFLTGALLKGQACDVPIRKKVRQCLSPFPSQTPLLGETDIALTNEHCEIIDVPLASIPQMPPEIRRE